MADFEFDRNNVELAIANLEKQMGVGHLMQAVRNLLDFADGFRGHTWLNPDNIEGIVRALYPPNPDWSDEVKARHFRHMCVALSLDTRAVNEDVKTILKKAQNGSN